MDHPEKNPPKQQSKYSRKHDAESYIGGIHFIALVSDGRKPHVAKLIVSV